MTVEDAVEALAREPLRPIVLLKQLLAYPEHVTVHRVSGQKGAATLVVLDTSVSDYDWQAYPKAPLAVFIASDHPDLTSLLMPHVPRGVGILFKLDSAADVPPLQAHLPGKRRTAFVSFTSTAGAIEPDADVRVTKAPAMPRFGCLRSRITIGPGCPGRADSPRRARQARPGATLSGRGTQHGVDCARPFGRPRSVRDHHPLHLRRMISPERQPGSTSFRRRGRRAMLWHAQAETR